MSDEKKIKTEELSDEQLNEAAGGSAPTAGDPSKVSRKCANPQCNTTLPADYPDDLCLNCKRTVKGAPHSSFHRIEHNIEEEGYHR